MPANQYQITLFNTTWKDAFFTYEYPMLPKVGDYITFDSEDNLLKSLFIVESREFSVYHSDDLIEVTLHGYMEDDRGDFSYWERTKQQVLIAQEQHRVQRLHRTNRGFNLNA